MSDDVPLAVLIDNHPSLLLELDFLITLCETGQRPSDILIDQLPVILAQFVETREQRRRRSA